MFGWISDVFPIYCYFIMFIWLELFYLGFVPSSEVILCWFQILLGHSEFFYIVYFYVWFITCCFSFDIFIKVWTHFVNRLHVLVLPSWDRVFLEVSCLLFFTSLWMDVEGIVEVILSDWLNFSSWSSMTVSSLLSYSIFSWVSCEHRWSGCFRFGLVL